MSAYFICRKRAHTKNMRTKDIIMVVYADPKRPPFPNDVGLGLRKVLSDPERVAREYNNENSLRNILRQVRREMAHK